MKIFNKYNITITNKYIYKLLSITKYIYNMQKIISNTKVYMIYKKPLQIPDRATRQDI